MSIFRSRTFLTIIPILLTFLITACGGGGTTTTADVTLDITVQPDAGSSLSQDRFRYEIVVESGGERIKQYFLSTNEVVSASLPSGIPLNFYVGLYYAKGSSSDEEEFNVYLSSDSTENVVLTADETKDLYFTLDMTQSLKVESYFDPDFGSNGYGSVTGGIMSTGGEPYFSINPLVTSGSSTTKIFSYQSSIFTNPSTGLIGNGTLFQVAQHFSNRNYWFAGSANILTSTTGSFFAQTDIPNTAAFSTVTSQLADVVSLKSVGTTDEYYFLDYGQGYVSFNYQGAWSTVENVDFSEHTNLVSPYEPFLLDIEQDDSSPSNMFFASKAGLFYISESTLAKFSYNQKTDALNECEKEIKVDSGGAVLARRVRIINNNIYIGTRSGVYKINQSDPSWGTFTGSSGYTLFPSGNIEKMAEFYDETIISMEEYTISGSDILMIATPKRIIFKNITSGASRMFTVWDGLPLVPKSSFTNDSSLNPDDFSAHDVAPINFVLWDTTLSKFWIGTEYGLSTINYSDVF